MSNNSEIVANDEIEIKIPSVSKRTLFITLVLCICALIYVLNTSCIQAVHECTECKVIVNGYNVYLRNNTPSFQTFNYSTINVYNNIEVVNESLKDNVEVIELG